MGEHSATSAGHGRDAGAKVKGTLIVTLMKFLRNQGFVPEDVLARLPPSDRDRLSGILLPSGWYPADSVARFVDAATAALPNATKAEALMKMGHFSALTNLGPTGLRRAYIREGDPHHVLAAIERIYPTVYSTGRRTYQRTGERSAVIRGHGTRTAYDQCPWVTGWLQGVIELSGGRNAHVVESQCQGAGAPHCEYVVDWT